MADTILYVQTGLSDIAAGIGRITTAAEETAEIMNEDLGGMLEQYAKANP